LCQSLVTKYDPDLQSFQSFFVLFSFLYLQDLVLPRNKNNREIKIKVINNNNYYYHNTPEMNVINVLCRQADKRRYVENAVRLCYDEE